MNNSGGSATGGGINFQAAITTIAGIHISAGVRLHWLGNLVDDTPVSLSAETGGPGDDLSLEIKGGELVEIQIKKGLAKGVHLWQPLLKLSQAIETKKIAYGVLVVSPDSSQTIRQDLANDLIRAGDGQFDGLKNISNEFLSKICDFTSDKQAICERLRVVTMHCSETDSASIVASNQVLANICSTNTKIDSAWAVLYRDSVNLIQMRGKRNVQSLLGVLRANGIDLATNTNLQSPSSIYEKVTTWTLKATHSFTVSGISTPLPLDSSWIQIKLAIKSEPLSNEGTLDEALKKYHARSGNDAGRSGREIDPETVGRFVRQCVVVAGPGMGKSTYLKKLARVYSANGYPVLQVRLQMLAAHMSRNGVPFEQGIFSIGLYGSGIHISTAISAPSLEWVLLCDGLDECSTQQEAICQGLLNFVAGRPNCRAIVTTRPVGYHSSLLANWRHYDLFPLDSSSIGINIATLLSGVHAQESIEYQKALEFSQTELRENKASKIASRSPLLLGLVTALALHGINFGRNRVELYERLFSMLQGAKVGSPSGDAPSVSVVSRYIDLLGHVMISGQTMTPADVIDRCAGTLHTELGLAVLKGRELSEELLLHCERIGLVERIHFSGNEALTFTHRTFGEYAAARFLCSSSAETKRQAIASQITKKNPAEWIVFAGALGMIDETLEEMLKSAGDFEAKKNVANQCLALIKETEASPRQELRNELMSLSLEIASSQNRKAALSIGERLLELGSWHNEELGARAQLLLDSTQSWTRLVGLALLFRCKQELPTLDLVVTEFESLKSHINYVYRAPLRGGLSLGADGIDLVLTVALGTIPILLSSRPGPESEQMIVDLLRAYDPYRNHQFRSDVIATLKTFGKEHLADCLTPQEDYLTRLIGNEESRKAHLVAQRRVLALIGSILAPHNDDVPHVADQSGRLTYLSAFLSGSGYDRWFDSREWPEEFDEEPVHEALDAILKITDIPRDELSRDVATLASHLETIDHDDYMYSEWYERVVSIDIEPDWDAAKLIAVDTAKVEHALHHPSEWIVACALHILGNKLTVDDLIALCARVFDVGKDYALWATAELGAYANVQQASELAITRLQRPIFSGSKFLFELIAKAEIQRDHRLLTAIQSGLILGPRTAEAAAAIAQKVASQGDGELDAVMRDAYDYWKEKEKPMPEAGGATPNSPRAQILSVRAAIGIIESCELLLAAKDERHDVNEIAEKEMLVRFINEDGLRTQLLECVREGSLKSRLLSRAISTHVPFSSVQIDQICLLLASDNKRIRYAAMSIFGQDYLPQDRARELAQLRLADPDEEIRDHARALLSKIE